MSKEKVIEQALLVTAITVQPELIPVVDLVVTAYVAKKASKALYKGFKKLF